MRWLTNIYDQNEAIEVREIHVPVGENSDDAWDAHKKWLADKIIGKPMATEFHSVEELESMHMVGVYMDVVANMELIP